MRNIFKHRLQGTNLDENKHRTRDKAIEDATVPKFLFFPVSMHIGAPAEPVVEIGDQVKIGSVLAEASSAVSANIISSVSGKVVKIEEFPIAGGKETCIVVKNDFEEEREAPLIEPGTADQLSTEEKIKLIRQAGIVGMGGATFPSDIKLQPEDATAIDTILINGAECEPYSTSDIRTMIEFPHEIIKGALHLRDMFPGSQIIIGIEHQNTESIKSMEEAAKDYEGVRVQALDHLYPQGAEKVLIKNTTGREVPPGGLPADVGCIVKNVGTSQAIFKCLEYGQPLIERVTTVSGTPLKESKNLRVRIGTRMNQLIKDCGGFVQAPGRVLDGGPMMGQAVDTGTVPVTKGTTCITVQSVDEAQSNERTDCIRCAECINVCPVGLQPILISNAYEHGDIEKAEALGAMDCIECGNCSYICPSNIPLLANIRQAKAAIQSKGA